MGLKGARDREDELSDVESEREALRRQRLEAANELALLKRDLSERVAQVQLRERELADALARVEKREQKLDAADERGSRLDSVRLRLAEAKAARTTLDERRAELDARERELAAREAALEMGTDTATAAVAPPTPEPVVSDELDARAASLDAREAELAEGTSALAERQAALDARAAELDARAAELDAREQAVHEAELEPPAVPEEVVEHEPAPGSDELGRIEAKLAELREAEQAFVRTQHELAARSDALAEQEAALAERERALAARETPAPSPDLELLEARISRLEQGGRARPEEAQTFSAGLRALQQRGLRGNHEPDEPLH